MKHVLYNADDFKDETGEELENNIVYVSVMDGGLDVCKVCGEFEAGLDKPCVPKTNYKSEEYKMSTNKEQLIGVMGYNQEEVKGMTEEDCEIELSYMSESQDV